MGGDSRGGGGCGTRRGTRCELIGVFFFLCGNVYRELPKGINTIIGKAPKKNGIVF